MTKRLNTQRIFFSFQSCKTALSGTSQNNIPKIIHTSKIQSLIGGLILSQTWHCFKTSSFFVGGVIVTLELSMYRLGQGHCLQYCYSWVFFCILYVACKRTDAMMPTRMMSQWCLASEQLLYALHETQYPRGFLLCSSTIIVFFPLEYANVLITCSICMKQSSLLNYRHY